MCILAIDDDPDELFLLGMICRRAGWKGELQRFESEEAAMAWCSVHPAPEVILSDLNLPAGTAWDLLPRIWALPGYSEVPAYVYTGLLPYDTEKRLAQFPNLKEVLEKPISDAILRNKLLPYCKGHHIS